MDRLAEILAAIGRGIFSVIEAIYWPDPNPEDQVTYFFGGLAWLVFTVLVIVALAYALLWYRGFRQRRRERHSQPSDDDDIPRKKDK